MKPAGMMTGTLALAFAVSTPAAWIPAATISEPGDFAGLAEVAIDRKGDAIAVWRGFDGANYRIRAAFRPRGGTFGAVQTLSDPGQDAGGPLIGPEIAVDKKGNAIAMWYRSDGTNERIEAAIQPVGGTFGSATTVSDPGSDARLPQLAIDRKGNAISVWSQSDGAYDRIRAAVRPAGGTFGAAQTLSDSGADGVVPQIAIDKYENAIAVWQRSETTADGVMDGIQAAIRSVDGTFGPAQSISDPSEDAYAPQIAIDGDRNATVVWSAHIGTNYRIRAAFRPAGGAFELPQTLSAAGQDARAPRIAIDGKGNTIAVWTRFDGLYDRVDAAIRPAGGTFATAVTLSDPGGDAEVPDIAFDKKGNAIAIWTRDDGTNQRIQAALRPVGGMFGMAETLTPPRRRRVLAAPRVRQEAERDRRLVRLRRRELQDPSGDLRALTRTSADRPVGATGFPRAPRLSGRVTSSTTSGYPDAEHASPST